MGALDRKMDALPRYRNGKRDTLTHCHFCGKNFAVKYGTPCHFGCPTHCVWDSEAAPSWTLLVGGVVASENRRKSKSSSAPQTILPVARNRVQ